MIDDDESKNADSCDNEVRPNSRADKVEWWRVSLSAFECAAIKS